MRASKIRQNMQPAAITVAAFTLLFACNAGGPIAPPRWAPAERIAGAWEWVSSLDVKTSQLHTPVTEQFTARLTFEALSKHQGTFTRERTLLLAMA